MTENKLEEYVKSLSSAQQETLALTWDHENENIVLRIMPPPVNERQFPKQKKWTSENVHMAQISNDVFYIMRKRKKQYELELGLCLTIVRKKIKLDVTIVKIFYVTDPRSICQCVQIELVNQKQ
jgi:hypothetical protein